MIRLLDQRVIAPSLAARCELARTVLEVGRDFALLAFRGADTHLHLEAACSERQAFACARRIEISLRHRLRLPVAFERARVKRVMDQRHLDHLFDYLFRQEEHHGIDLDPLFVASNLPDLLGLRVTGEYTRGHVAAFLPRVNRGRLLSFLGLPDLDRTPLVVTDLAEAAAAAFALPELLGRTKAAVRARRAAIAAATPLIGTAAIAEQLDISPRTVRHLRAEPARCEDVLAVQGQLRLRSAVRARGMLAGGDTPQQGTKR